MIKRLIRNLLNPNKAIIETTNDYLEQIKALRAIVSKMSKEEMQDRIREMKEELKLISDKIPESEKLSINKIDRTKPLSQYELDIQKKLYSFVPEVYTFIDEIFFRKAGFRYYDVQLRAGIILAQGQRLVELYTGEGKTMTFQLPAILYSLVGRGAHVVTVNDYLSRRDGEYAGHIASELGLSVGIINSDVSYKFVSSEELEKYKTLSDDELKRLQSGNINVSNMDGLNLIETSKKEAYNCDITYGTNNEFGFDYLRNNMAWNLEDLTQRELYFCIIDEADSILIDEARTPLIISGIPTNADTEKYRKFAKAVEALKEGEDYIIEYKNRTTVTLTEKGIKKSEEILGISNLWQDYSSAYHIEKALQAKAKFIKDRDYIVRNGEVLIVDEFTGRILNGRRYSDGLHQAIEAKEGLEIKPENITFATITFQNYFRLYKILCGGSGTIMTEGEEFYKIYGLESISIPTNKPVIRIDYPDRIYKNQGAKFKAVIKEIKEKHEKGQPVLVGTTSVEKSELVSKLLDEEGIKHEVLNAKYHEMEAKIIETAGRKYAVTVATNMAGRGADIVIGGGKRGDAAWKEVAALGGLHVIGTERHEARRIDNQLRGRTGRQGEPGSSRFYVSLDDTLMKILGGEIIAKLLTFAKINDDEPIEMPIFSRQIESAQKKIENLNFDARKNLVEYDDVMNQHREVFYTLRRNFLIKLSGIENNFLENGSIINLNLPEFSNLKNKYNDTINHYKLEIKNAIFNMYMDVLSKKTENYMMAKKIEEIPQLIMKYIPEQLLSINLVSFEAVDTIHNKLLAKIKTTNNNIDKFIEFISEILTKSLEIKYSEFGEDLYRLVKLLIFQSMDNTWSEHLEIMKDIKEGIFLQSYAQKDPLIEYKNKAFVVFQNFLTKIYENFISKFMFITKTIQDKTSNKSVLVTNVDDVKDISEGNREFISPNAIKINNFIDKEMISRLKQKSTVKTNANKESVQKKAEIKLKIGRNDRVTIQYKDGRIVENVKYKKVESDIRSGIAKIV